MVEYNENIDLIGTGALFPILIQETDQGKGWYPVQGDPALIENNLRSLIEYTIGQRFRQEEFGTRLWECLEEKNTQVLNFLIKKFLQEAVNTYENRIRIKRIITEREFSKLHILMEYALDGLSKDSYMDLTYNLT